MAHGVQLYSPAAHVVKKQNNDNNNSEWVSEWAEV